MVRFPNYVSDCSRAAPKSKIGFLVFVAVKRSVFAGVVAGEAVLLLGGAVYAP
jgi:hypothetical protein